MEQTSGEGLNHHETEKKKKICRPCKLYFILRKSIYFLFARIAFDQRKSQKISDEVSV